MKLEIKHLAPYVPYKTQGIYELKEVSSNYSDERRIKYLDQDNISFFLKYCKLILRPLSDLHNMIQKEFESGYDILQEINEHPSYDFDLFYSSIHKQLDLDMEFDDDKTQYFIEWNIIEEIREGLFKNHYDVFGLIDKGLAININTLKEE